MRMPRGKVVVVEDKPAGGNTPYEADILNEDFRGASLSRAFYCRGRFLCRSFANIARLPRPINGLGVFFACNAGLPFAIGADVDFSSDNLPVNGVCGSRSLFARLMPRLGLLIPYRQNECTRITNCGAA